MNKSKVAVSIAIITLSIRIVVGFLLTMFGLVGAVAVSETDGIAAIMMFVILFSVPGVLISISGFKCRKRIELFKKYVAILANDESGSISNLALETNASENIVQSNLQKMIDKKYFSNAYIDLNMNCVVFPNRVSTAASTFNSTPSQGFGVEATSEISTVTCKGCGASNNVAKGQVRECEYCGSAIKG